MRTLCFTNIDFYSLRIGIHHYLAYHIALSSLSPTRSGGRYHFSNIVTHSGSAYSIPPERWPRHWYWLPTSRPMIRRSPRERPSPVLFTILVQERLLQMQTFHLLLRRLLVLKLYLSHKIQWVHINQIQPTASIRHLPTNLPQCQI